jgi:hypothetical protein
MSEQPLKKKQLAVYLDIELIDKIKTAAKKEKSTNVWITKVLIKEIEK